MVYCIDVITADISRLKNRALAYAFTSSPYIITAFSGSKVADDLLGGIGMRWGFGIFAIIFPAVACPLYFVLKFNIKKARKEGYQAQERANRTFLQKIRHYIVEFDCKVTSLYHSHRRALTRSSGRRRFFLGWSYSLLPAV